ncbi:hypothetical protein [Frankia umida]|nr:hypothetical protein [Frankia umida]
MFALLLAAADTVDAIVDSLAGGEPPASAMASLQVCVEPAAGP